MHRVRVTIAGLAGGVGAASAKPAAMRRVPPRPSQQVQWHGWFVDDCDGDRIGTLEAVYEEAESAVASWLLIRLTRFSTRYALAPSATVLAGGGRVWVPYTRGTVERAPLLYEPPTSIDRAVERQLRGHYGLAGEAVPEIRASARHAAA